MGINHLQLSQELIALLYPDSLVAAHMPDEPGENGKPSHPLPVIYDFKGENLRSCCFLVDYPGQEFIPEEQLRFLNRILSACKYSPDDIALINAARFPINFLELKKQLHPLILFLWGLPPSSIGLNGNLPDYQISIIDNVSVIPVPGVELMNGTSPEGLELKQRLWTCLKKLFNL
jgi:hypothetical protein